jgi:hypothetical protein
MSDGTGSLMQEVFLPKLRLLTEEGLSSGFSGGFGAGGFAGLEAALFSVVLASGGMGSIGRWTERLTTEMVVASRDLAAVGGSDSSTGAGAGSGVLDRCGGESWLRF